MMDPFDIMLGNTEWHVLSKSGNLDGSNSQKRKYNSREDMLCTQALCQVFHQSQMTLLLAVQL